MTILVVFLLCQTFSALFVKDVVADIISDVISSTVKLFTKEILKVKPLEIVNEIVNINPLEIARAILPPVVKDIVVPVMEKVVQPIAEAVVQVGKKILTTISKIPGMVLKAGLKIAKTIEQTLGIIHQFAEKIHTLIIVGVKNATNHIFGVMAEMLPGLKVLVETAAGAYAIARNVLWDLPHYLSEKLKAHYKAVKKLLKALVEGLKYVSYDTYEALLPLIKLIESMESTVDWVVNKTALVVFAVGTVVITIGVEVADAAIVQLNNIAENPFKYLILVVGMGVIMGIITATGPITAPFLFGVVIWAIAKDFIVGMILTLIKKLLNFLITLAPTKIQILIKCLTSVDIIKLILMVLEMLLSLIISSKIEGGLQKHVEKALLPSSSPSEARSATESWAQHLKVPVKVVKANEDDEEIEENTISEEDLQEGLVKLGSVQHFIFAFILDILVPRGTDPRAIIDCFHNFSRSKKMDLVDFVNKIRPLKE